MTDRAHIVSNERSRLRIERLAASLTAGDDDVRVDADWSVSALLGHVAFWDRFHAARWQAAIAAGLALPAAMPDPHPINDALFRLLWRLPARAAAEAALEAATAANAIVAALPDASVEAARAAGMPRLIDRSLHRDEHLAAIEAALARSREAEPGRPA